MMQHIKNQDPQMHQLLEDEKTRQKNKIRLIASENYTSHAVLEALASTLTNKYSEGYPKKRYYEGQQITDQIETLAINRAKQLFQAEHANVQALSGAPANMAVYFSFLNPGDKIMGLSLPHGGHLTHGWKVSFSGKIYNPVPYRLNPKTGLLDYGAILKIAKLENPKLIIAGASAYPRTIHFDRFAKKKKVPPATLR